MQLRLWQNQCIKSALRHYKQHRNFLCLATPGAGKTIMAASLAKQMLKSGDIEYVLCFSPSTIVSRSIAETFSFVLGKKFDGKLASIGLSLTYQGLLSLKDEFWDLLSQHRVLVIFDEIHHCSGLEFEQANSWGKAILKNIQDRASYTLSLTGTPWRSDEKPIVLANYENQSSIECHYTYGLSSAINDNVCRKPKIALVDCEKIVFKNNDEQHSYSSLTDLTQRSDVSYQSLLNDKKLVSYVLSQAIEKLESIKQRKPNAAGLLVVSSVSEARTLRKELIQKYGQTAVVATYYEHNSAEIIEDFRNNNVQWIVSVGMISEGTDIPRLHVCCHLSRITTELYFRQILGRILRKQSTSDPDAWLFVPAESNIVEYANRIEKEIPDTIVKLDDFYNANSTNKNKSKSSIANTIVLASEILLSEEDIPATETNISNVNAGNNDSLAEFTLDFVGDLKSLVLATFDMPLSKA